MSGAVPNEGYEYRSQVAGARPGESLVVYLARRYPHSSEQEWRDRVVEGRVLVDGARAHPDAEVRAGQALVWSRPPWVEPEAPRNVEIVHEDDDLLAVAKPAGLPTLPGAGYLRNTLLSVVRERFPEASPLHRLGRWTSGVTLFARTGRARAVVSEAWRDGRVRKVYRALAVGDPAQDRFEIRTPIGPVPYAPLGTVHAASPDGKAAESEVEVLERREGLFLARVVILTGRPHQVRIHLAAAGYPLAGDPLYGSGGTPREGAAGALPGDPGYHLHAEEIGLSHPATGEAMLVRCEPSDPLRGGERTDGGR